MSKLTAVVKTLAAAAALVAVSAASATPIIGTVSLGLGLVEVTPYNIDWNNGTNGNNNPPPNAVQTYGQYQAYNATGSFTATTPSTSISGNVGLGLIQDMSNFAAIGPADANQVSIGANNIANFFQFSSQPGWLFTLTNLSAGTIPQTPYQLTEQTVNGSTSTIAQISVSGTACDASLTGGVCTASDDVTDWVATLSATYAGYTISELQTLLTANPFALPNQNWSGNLTAVAMPEPGSLALVGLALAGVGFVARRRKA